MLLKLFMKAVLSLLALYIIGVVTTKSYIPTHDASNIVGALISEMRQVKLFTLTKTHFILVVGSGQLEQFYPNINDTFVFQQPLDTIDADFKKIHLQEPQSMLTRWPTLTTPYVSMFALRDYIIYITKADVWALSLNSAKVIKLNLNDMTPFKDLGAMSTDQRGTFYGRYELDEFWSIDLKKIDFNISGDGGDDDWTRPLSITKSDYRSLCIRYSNSTVLISTDTCRQYEGKGISQDDCPNIRTGFVNNSTMIFFIEFANSIITLPNIAPEDDWHSVQVPRNITGPLSFWSKWMEPTTVEVYTEPDVKVVTSKDNPSPGLAGFILTLIGLTFAFSLGYLLYLIYCVPDPKEEEVGGGGGSQAVSIKKASGPASSQFTIEAKGSLLKVPSNSQTSLSKIKETQSKQSVRSLGKTKGDLSKGPTKQSSVGGGQPEMKTATWV